MNTLYFVKFSLCFVCYLLRTVYQILERKKSRIVAHKSMPTIIGGVMFFQWFFWFSMNFSDPVRLVLPTWLRYIGLAVFVVGAVLVIISHRHIKEYATEDRLITTGIYSNIRHPMYVGFMLWLIGFPLFMQSIVTLASAVIWIACFICWQILEEKDLEFKFREYKEYKKKSWF